MKKHDEMLLLFSLKHTLNIEQDKLAYVGMCLCESLSEYSEEFLNIVKTLIEEAFKEKKIEDVDDIFTWKEILNKINLELSVKKFDRELQVNEFVDTLNQKLEKKELFPNHRCVQCGECCSNSPCGFGESNADGGCKFLTEDNLCGKYEEIIKDPSSIVSPAFGKGCCRSLFNEGRSRIIREKFKGEEQLLGYLHYDSEGNTEVFDVNKNLVKKCGPGELY